MSIKNGDLPAMPVSYTKREMFAMAAMQGLLSSLSPDEVVTGESLAKSSIAVADALLAELERTNEPL